MAREWLLIETEFPNGYRDGPEVLIVTESGGIYIGILNSTTNKWWEFTGRVFKIKPTHWMPLPDPPKEK